MTKEQFETLIRRHEQLAQRNPRSYRFKLFLLALLGNAYLGTILIALTALLVATIVAVATVPLLALKLGLLVGGFVWMMLGALWLKAEPPEGITLQRSQAPELIGLIENIRLRLDAPKVHRIAITPELNAGVRQVPRLGIFGWMQNHLMLGLPLLQSLTEEQLGAVLAHEFGHLAGGHGRWSNWIYRQRLRWARLLGRLDARQSRGGFLFQPFLRWFAPRFGAYSFPLARANEYAADAAAVRLTSPEAAAEALSAVEVVGQFLGERYWPDILRQTRRLRCASIAPYQTMADVIAVGFDPGEAAVWLDRALGRATGVEDTHPSLRDRLAAIGQAPRLALPRQEQAADRLLGEARVPMIEALDRKWRHDIEPHWEQRQRDFQQAEEELAALDARAAQGEALTGAEAYRRAALTGEIGAGPEEALAQCQVWHQRLPNDALACMALGSRLLAKNDRSGYALIERAMELNDGNIVQGATLLKEYCLRHGQSAEAEIWNQRFDERMAIERLAAQERQGIKIGDPLEPHGLGSDALEAFVLQLRNLGILKTAYLERKRVVHLPHRPIYVFGFTVSTAYWGAPGKTREQGVIEALWGKVTFPGETLLVCVSGENAELGRVLRRVEGAELRLADCTPAETRCALPVET